MNKQRYLELIQPAIEIVQKKDQDYGNAKLGRESYFPFGAKSYVQMLHVKSQRLVSLTQEENVTPNFESVEDTLKDMINYAVFMLDWMHKDDVQ